MSYQNPTSCSVTSSLDLSHTHILFHTSLKIGVAAWRSRANKRHHRSSHNFCLLPDMSINQPVKGKRCARCWRLVSKFGSSFPEMLGCSWDYAISTAEVNASSSSYFYTIFQTTIISLFHMCLHVCNTHTCTQAHTLKQINDILRIKYLEILSTPH